MQEKGNILRILTEAKTAIKGNDTFKLKELSNQTIHTASIAQDPDNIAIAVIIYSLSKIIERGYDGTKNKCSKLCKDVIFSMNGIIEGIKEKNDVKLRNSMESLRKKLFKVSSKMKAYIQDVFTKASINKASKIYEHGISIEQTAKLLGITMFELAGYAGQKGELSEERFGEKTNVKARLKLAMEMFA
ncbi:MAG: hypothetical protein AABX30_01990 [Nanoarchaeota archaeon]